MWFNSLMLILFISILPVDVAFTQPVIEKKDSIRIYKRIESFSEKTRFTKFLYRLAFRPIVKVVPENKKKKKAKRKTAKSPYSDFEGKIIRHINIEILDPFGYSVTDTANTSQNYLSRVGNKLHLKSQQITIRNLLLIKQNQLFDPLLVQESERLVRSQSYVHDVSFLIKEVSKNSDSVDIFIRELDNWSIAANMDITKSHIAIQLTEKNFLGSGHTLTPDFNWIHSTGDYAFKANYYVPNIRNTYINTMLHYSMDEFKNSVRYFAIDRPLFSPYSRYAGGLFYLRQFYRDSLHSADSASVLQSFTIHSQDYWMGYATRIFAGKSVAGLTTNFISAVRYYNVRYLEMPMAKFDSLHSFSDEDFYLASAGISSRKYVQDNHIFKYGRTEDVPVGKVLSVTGGLHVKNNSHRFYLGVRFSLGNYYQWGYLSSNFECGTYFHSSHSEQGVIKASVNYYTELFRIGKWKFRQFAKPQITLGINRFSFENITINDGFGIDGFNSDALTGTNRILLTLQTQSYAPWSIIGFRFGPYFILSLAMLSDSKTGFKNCQMYSLIGFGVLIKNEYLVFSTLQFSISFYPIIPGNGLDVFKYNSFKTTDFGFRDFEIGKPSAIVYQ